MPQDPLFIAFIAVWVLLAGTSGLFFFLSKNAPLKRKLWPPFSIFTALLFGAFAWAMGIPTQHLLLMLPFLVVVVVMNLRAIQFCNSCGATITSQSLAKAKFCSKCGSSLSP